MNDRRVIIYWLRNFLTLELLGNEVQSLGTCCPE
jgi:hypothetical protein